MATVSIDVDSSLVSRLLLNRVTGESLSDLLARFLEELNVERKLRTYFQKYVPVDILEKLSPRYGSLLSKEQFSGLRTADGKVATVGIEHDYSKTDNSMTCTILSCSIANYELLAEKLPLLHLSNLLYDYYSEVFEAIAACNGFVDNAAGGRIVAVWAKSSAMGRGVAMACKCAIRISKVPSWSTRMPADISVRIGVSSGPVVLQDFPPGNVLGGDLSIVGHPVNVAKGLEESDQ